jgi:hypothetical protein
MNRHQAQRILLAYRLGESVPADSDLAKALAFAAEDPSLGAWLEQELAADRSLRRALSEVAPPPGLRESILAASKITVIPWWRRSPAWTSVLAAAAAVVVFLGIQFARSPGSVSRTAPKVSDTARATAAGMEDFQAEMVRLVSTGAYRLELDTERLAAVKRFLDNRGQGFKASIPSALEQLETYGCQAFDWHGETVVLICFRASDVSIAHLFIVDAKAIRNPPEARMALSREGDWSVAGWRDGEKVLIVCSPAGLSDLKRFLGV